MKLFFLQRKNNISGIPVLLLPIPTRSHDASLLLAGASCAYPLWCWRSVFLPAFCCSGSCELGWNSVNHNSNLWCKTVTSKLWAWRWTSCISPARHLVLPSHAHRSSSMSRSAAHVPALACVSHCCGAASRNFSKTHKIKSSSFPMFVLLWWPHNQPCLRKGGDSIGVGGQNLSMAFYWKTAMEMLAEASSCLRMDSGNFYLSWGSQIAATH